MIDHAAGWGILWRSESLLDGKEEHLMGRHFGPGSDVPPQVAGHDVMVFRTRAAARSHISQRYGWIADQPQFRAEPFGLKMPMPVRVDVQVKYNT